MSFRRVIDEAARRCIDPNEFVNQLEAAAGRAAERRARELLAAIARGSARRETEPPRIEADRDRLIDEARD